jgi:hypothetical protein
MHPVLNDGDEILVDQSRRALADGIHVVRVGTMFWSRGSTWGAPEGAPEKRNPAYDPIDLSPEEVA